MTLKLSIKSVFKALSIDFSSDYELYINLNRGNLDQALNCQLMSI